MHITMSHWSLVTGHWSLALAYVQCTLHMWHVLRRTGHMPGVTGRRGIPVILFGGYYYCNMSNQPQAIFKSPHVAHPMTIVLTPPSLAHLPPPTRKRPKSDLQKRP